MATTTQSFVPLESGDRLTREEFHRRYCARPDIRKANLVEGVVYVSSPVRFVQHSQPQGIVVMWLQVYAASTPGVEAGVDATILLSETSEVQPDGLLFRVQPPGNARINERGYIEGAPELIVEIAASSASYDLHDKMEAYRKAGVEEYVVWQVFEKRIDRLRLSNGVYVPLQPNADGVIESEVFPGLRLPVAAMLAGDRAAVLAAVRET
ncbi:MAG: Uma2 family endonuclease [Dehalococcoidia bacterium]